ncbi:MAG: uroporphyrinogen decarboxylase family protein [Acutalibacteraceae bacterium]
MTKHQMIKSTIAHENTGKTPFTINMTGETYDAYGSKLLERYANAKIIDDYINERLSMYEAVSLAIGNYIIHVFGPWWDWYNIPECFKNDFDPPAFYPDTIGTGSYEEFFEHTRYLKENYDVYLDLALYGAHWEKAYFCRGIENFLADLAGNPEWSKGFLQTIIRKNIVMLENLLVCPDIDAVLFGSDWGTQNSLIMSPTCFRTMIKEGETAEFDLARKYGKDIFVHSCGNIELILDDLVEMGVQVLNPIQPECMDIARLKKDYGDKFTFFGGIGTQRVLPYGTPEEVAAETERVIELMGKDGGYITSPSQDIQPDVPYENLIALIDTAKKYA